MTDTLATASKAAAHLPPVLRWSLADAWAWLGHAWMRFIHAPYLGLVGLVLLALVLLRALDKLLR